MIEDGDGSFVDIFDVMCGGNVLCFVDDWWVVVCWVFD